MFKFVLFKAIEDTALCEAYLIGHRKILKDYGIENITTNNEEWMFDENVHVIAAMTKSSNEIVGGIRIHKSTEKRALPIEDAIFPMDSRISELIKFDRHHGCGEACGLWNSRLFFGKGLSPLLSRTAVAYSHFVGINSLFCLAANYTTSIAQKIGFNTVREIGESGQFVYPIPSITAHIMRVPDVMTLEYADLKEKYRIQSLRRSPHQVFIESSQNRNIVVEYDVKILEPTLLIG
jgi:hypothetical protein